MKIDWTIAIGVCLGICMYRFLSLIGETLYLLLKWIAS